MLKLNHEDEEGVRPSSGSVSRTAVSCFFMEVTDVLVAVVTRVVYRVPTRRDLKRRSEVNY